MLIRDAKKNPVEEDSNEKQMPTWKIPVLLLIGIAAIVLGGDITVDSAKEIAASLGMSENLIGLTVVSVGTSLPELVTSVTAAKKAKAAFRSGTPSAPTFSTFFSFSALPRRSRRLVQTCLT
nr:hypothetical protein [Allobaculum sp. Allo2]